MTRITVTLTPETERRLREKAGGAGLTPEAYLGRLAEGDADDGTPPRAPPTFEAMTGPFARAVEASGMSEEELKDFFADAVKEAHAERRARK